MQQKWLLTFILISLTLVVSKNAVAQNKPQDTTGKHQPLVQQFKSGECSCTASGFTIQGPVKGFWDSSYFPNHLVYYLQVDNIKGVGVTIFTQGKTGIKLFNKEKKAIKFPDKVNQDVVQTSAEGDFIKLRLRIPVNPHDKNNRQHVLRYRWKNETSRMELKLTCTLEKQLFFF